MESLDEFLNKIYHGQYSGFFWYKATPYKGALYTRPVRKNDETWWFLLSKAFALAKPAILNVSNLSSSDYMPEEDEIWAVVKTVAKPNYRVITKHRVVLLRVVVRGGWAYVKVGPHGQGWQRTELSHETVLSFVRSTPLNRGRWIIDIDYKKITPP